MATANDILKIAQGEIGVTESPAGSNNVKYNTAYYGGAVNGSQYPWCCVFVWWVFKQAGASELFYGGGKTASCTTLMNYYKKNGQTVTDWKPGDIVFYQFDTDLSAEHMGIIEQINPDGSIIAIEGNTSLTSDDNGGSVMRRVRKKSLILAVMRPEYAQEEYSGTVVNASTTEEVTTVSVELTVCKKGMKGYPEIKTIQRLLRSMGYTGGGAALAIDGSFGPATDEAVRKFQNNRGLSVDGSVGPATWRALLK